MRNAVVVAIALCACGKDAGPGGAGSSGNPPSEREVIDELVRAKRDLAKRQVDRIAFETYPMWAVRNPDKACPESLAAMLAILGEDEKTGRDPWGQPVRIACGAQAPKDVRGFGASSVGPDLKPDTADDIVSWKK